MPYNDEPHWTFNRAAGRMTLPACGVTFTAYSGHGAGLDNPAMEAVRNVGPLPAGFYHIGHPRFPVDHLGPLAMPLVPDASNQMDGRNAFFIHGDNQAMNHTASDGCIIVSYQYRHIIAWSSIRLLEVI